MPLGRRRRAAWQRSGLPGPPAALARSTYPATAAVAAWLVFIHSLIQGARTLDVIMQRGLGGSEQSDGLPVAGAENGMSCSGRNRLRVTDGFQYLGLTAGIDDSSDLRPEEAINNSRGSDECPFLPEGTYDVMNHREVDAGNVQFLRNIYWDRITVQPADGEGSEGCLLPDYVAVSQGFLYRTSSTPSRRAASINAFSHSPTGIGQA
ncbi:MAG: hypothetical protein NVS2B15_08190 [Pseudarthrobacter sp.]